MNARVNEWVMVGAAIGFLFGSAIRLAIPERVEPPPLPRLGMTANADGSVTIRYSAAEVANLRAVAARLERDYFDKLNDAQPRQAGGTAPEDSSTAEGSQR